MTLSDEEKAVLFEKATEPAFSGSLLYEKRHGSYHCKNCKASLFSSDKKFDSGSGWPSFTQPSSENGLTLRQDTSHGMSRTEIICTTCGAHLGHVFDDGPQEAGGKRYCVNSLSLTFKTKRPPSS